MEYNGQPVVTFKQIAGIHGQAEKGVRMAFQRNRGRFAEGEDYILISGG